MAEDQIERMYQDITQKVALDVETDSRWRQFKSHPFETGTPSQAPLLYPKDLGRFIDHTLLKPEASQSQIEKACEEALKYGFAKVCLNGMWIHHAANLLKGSRCSAISVIGFPLGAMATQVKVFETQTAITDGASEIDMVLNIGALKSKDYSRVAEDIRAVVRAALISPVKVILETHLLSDDEKIAACLIAKGMGAAFVKTSTGFGGGGATISDVKLMRAVVGDAIGVKASGGVRSYDDAIQMIRAGASRIGTSNGVAIVGGAGMGAGTY